MDDTILTILSAPFVTALVFLLASNVWVTVLRITHHDELARRSSKKLTRLTRYLRLGGLFDINHHNSRKA